MSSDESEYDEKQPYLLLVADILKSHNKNGSPEITEPILNPGIKPLFWPLILLYGALSLLGLLSNLAVIIYAMYYKLFKDITHAFIVNLALCHFIQCSIVLPITLTVMLIQNWIFGQFLCFFLPMLQDIPLHVAIISHILIAWDRMRWLGDPLKGRLPTFVCCCATWLAGMVIALPYPIYTIYVDLGEFIPSLKGTGICIYNLMDDMHEYMRGLFLMMYCGPSVLLAYLYIRTSQELRPPDGPFAVMMFEHRAELRNRQRNSSTSSTVDADRPVRLNSTRSYDLYNAEMDVTREKRTQRTLGSMAATQVICICPLMILRLARLVVGETYENSKHFDVTYLLFIWMAFLPTVIFPFLYASQLLPGTEKERLRCYFRLTSSTRQRKKTSHDSSIEQENITSTTIVDTPITTTNSFATINNNKTHPVKSITTTLNGSAAAPITTTKIPSQLKHNADDGSVFEKYPRKSIKKEIIKNNNTNQLTRDNKSRGQLSRNSYNNKNYNDSNETNISENLRVPIQTNSIKRNSFGLEYNNTSGRGSIQSTTSLLSSPRRAGGDLASNSGSNITSSTYCNTGSSILIANNKTGSGVVIDPLRSRGSLESENDFEKKWLNSLPLTSASMIAQNAIRHKDVSFSETSSLAGSSILTYDTASNFDRDLEIIDLLERERSMDIQDMMEREKHVGHEITRTHSRKLPNIERIRNKSRNDTTTYFPEKSDLSSRYDSGYYQRRFSNKSNSSSIRSKRESLKSISGDCTQLANASLVSSGNVLPSTNRVTNEIGSNLLGKIGFSNTELGEALSVRDLGGSIVSGNKNNNNLLSGGSLKNNSAGLMSGNVLASSPINISGDKISVIEQRIKQQQHNTRNSYSSSAQSSIKSREFTKSPLQLRNSSSPQQQSDDFNFKENICANL